MLGNITSIYYKLFCLLQQFWFMMFEIEFDCQNFSSRSTWWVEQNLTIFISKYQWVEVQWFGFDCALYTCLSSDVYIYISFNFFYEREATYTSIIYRETFYNVWILDKWTSSKSWIDYGFVDFYQ